MFGRAPPYARERRVFKGRGGSRWPSLAFLSISFVFKPALCWAQAGRCTIQPESSDGALPIRSLCVGCWRQLVDLIT